MKKANPKLVFLAVAMLAGTLALKVVPSLMSGYAQLSSDKESLKQELIYYQNLVEEESELKQRAEEARELVMGIEDSVFNFRENLFGSEVQAIIRNVSSRNGVEVREMRVAKLQSFEDWVKVSQELSFTTSQRNILPFLNALKSYRPRLYVSKLTITRSRQQFVGSLTVEAFSRNSNNYD